jgi:hypothetical protein
MQCLFRVEVFARTISKSEKTRWIFAEPLLQANVRILPHMNQQVVSGKIVKLSIILFVGIKRGLCARIAGYAMDLH